MNDNGDVAVQIINLKKKYRLGVIGGGTLQGDIQSWWAKKRGKEDPNLKIGQKEYGKNETFMALNGIDLIVKKGERLGIIGHNGAGKSTLLKILSRVTAPTEGKICIDGRISSMLEVGTGFNPELTGRENIYLNGAILGMSRAEVDSKINEIIEFSECGQFIDTPVKRYSSGMYVKLAFSVAAHLDSEILIMDEVLAVGDMKFQQKCLGKMSDVSESEGKTVLYVSHNMNTIRQLCDRCIVLNQGKSIFDGDVEEAIEIYMDKENAKSLMFVDFNQIERDKPELGKNARLEYFEFVEKKDSIFTQGEKIKFRLKWKKENGDNEYSYRLFFSIRYADNSVVASCFSQVLEKEDAIYKLDVSQLVEGKYSFAIALYGVNSFGTETMCDHSIIRIPFTVINKGKVDVEWNRQWWGNIRLANICEVKV